MNWQPIADAPKDGTQVDLWADGRYTDAWFQRSRWVNSQLVYGEWRTVPLDEEPTHFLLIPEPPK